MVPDKFVTVNDQRNSIILLADQSQYSYLSEYTFWSLLLVDKPYWPVQIIQISDKFLVKSASEYFIMESIDNLKRSLSAYKGHLSKARDSFNAILAVQPGPTLKAFKRAYVKVQDRIEAYSNSIERLFTALMNEGILSEQVIEEERVRIEEYHKQLLKLQCQIETDFVKFNSNYEASNDGSIVPQVSAHPKISDSPKPIIRLTALEPPCWNGLKAEFYTWKNKFVHIMAEAQISDDLTQLCYLQKPNIIPSEYQTLITDCLTLYEA